MAENFVIRVVVDPKSAKKSIDNVERRLEVLTERARRVGLAFSNTFDPSSSARDLAQVQRQLIETGRRAQRVSAQMKRDLSRAFRIDRRAIDTTFDRADRRIAQTTTGANSLGAAMRRAFIFLGGAGLVVAGGRQLASFGEEMAKVRAITEATDVQFEDLREEAKRLGLETRFSATEAAEGLTFLARAGFDADQALGAVEGTLRLAQAGNIELGRAADIASNVLKGFRLNVDETARVVDVLALAANSSNTNVEQLGDALKFVAPVAAGLGLSIEDVVASVGTLSDAGLQATLAGTGLRRVLSELEAPSSAARKILNELNSEIDRGSITAFGLFGALGKLQEAGVDTSAALQIFGDRGGPAFEVLSSGSDAAEALAEKLRGAEGTAERVAAIMDDTLSGAFHRVRSAAEGLNLALGDGGATSALRAFAETLAEGLRGAARNVEQVILAVEGLAVAFGTRLALQAIPSVIASLKALGVALLTNPITLLPSILGLAIGSVVAFRHEIADLQVAGTRVGDVISASWEAFAIRAEFVFQQVGVIAGELFDALAFAWPKVLDGMVRALGPFGDAITKVWGAVFGPNSGLYDFVRVYGNFVIATFETVADVISAVGRDLAEKFNALADFDPSSPLDSAKRLALAFNPVASSVGIAEDAVASFTENLGKDYIGDIVDFGEKTAEHFLSGFQGLFGGDAVSAFFDVGGDIAARIAEKEGARQGRVAAAAFQVAVDAAQLVLVPGLAAQQGGGGGVPAPFAPQAPEADPGGAGSEQAKLSATERRADILNQVNAELERERKLLALSAGARDVESQALNIENNLLAEKVQLTDQEALRLRERLTLLQGLEDQARIYESIRGPQEEAIRTQEALNALFNENRITAQEYARAMNDVGAALDRVSGTAAGGFSAGLKTANNILNDTSSLAESTVVNAFGAAEDAIAKFATTGKFSFSDLLESIQADLARLLARQALLGLLNALTGGLGGTALGAVLGGGGFGGGRASGGDVQGGRSYLVGEEGPELFTPPSAGNVVPAGETAAIMSQGQQAAPVVNVEPAQVSVSNVIVSDPSEIPSGIESPAGTKAVMNVISKNKGTVGGILS